MSVSLHHCQKRNKSDFYVLKHRCGTSTRNDDPRSPDRPEYVPCGRNLDITSAYSTADRKADFSSTDPEQRP